MTSDRVLLYFVFGLHIFSATAATVAVVVVVVAADQEQKQRLNSIAI